MSQVTATIIVALITGGASLLGVVITNHSSNNKMISKMEIQQAITDEKLSEMNRRISEHNNLVSRMYAVEKDLAILKEAN